jgi:hypothetical protein
VPALDDVGLEAAIDDADELRPLATPNAAN